MKYQIILLLLFCFISLTAQDEYLVKLKNLETLDNESITDISLLDEQHVLLTSGGAFDENQPYNWKLINRKFNVEDMSVVWKKYYTHEENYTMSPNSVIRNKKGNIIITGSTKHTDAFELNLDDGNAFVVEMNPEGEVMWSNSIGEAPTRDWGVDITDIDGGYILTGWKYRNTETFVTNAVVRKVSVVGDSLWTVEFQGEGGFNFKGVQVVRGYSNSVYVVVDQKHSVFSGSLFSITHIDGQTGEIFWSKEYPIGDGNEVYNASLTADSLLLLEGEFRREDSNCTTPIVWKIDLNGKIVFQKDFEVDLGCAFGRKFIPTLDGGFALLIREDGRYPRLVKLNKDYDVEWERVYDLELYLSITGVVQMPDGTYILGGREGATDIYTIWLIKTDSEGGLLTATEVVEDQQVLVKAFPNPTTDILNISLEGVDNAHVQIKIFDLLGNEVLHSGYTNSMNVEYLESGSYFLHVFEKNDLRSVTKFIKM